MRRTAFGVLLLTGTLLFASAAFAEPAKESVEADVSTRSVAITSSFTGTEILIFGTVENSRQPSPEAGTYDVVVVVEGTQVPQIVRRKSNLFGFWINTKAMRFASFPSYYAIATTRPIDEIADHGALDKLEIGFEHVHLVPSGSGTRYGPDDPKEVETYKAAVIRLKQRERLYLTADYGVTFIGRSLFRSTISLPPNVPVGPLTTRVYLFKDGQMLSQYKSQVTLEREGLERFLFDSAYKNSLLYGLATVLFAAAAGLAAAFGVKRLGY